LKAKIVLLAGDGIGPEVAEEARNILDVIAVQGGHRFFYDEHLFGGCAIDEYGTPLTDETLAECKAADAVLLGAVGGPKWSSPSATVRPEQGLLRLRKEMGLFANLRPLTLYPILAGASPLKKDRLQGVDILFVRELTGGIYFGKPSFREDTEDGERAVDTMSYSTGEVRRVARLAFELALSRTGKLTSVDKANVLESSRLWRQVVSAMADEYPGVILEHQLVDSMAMRLIQSPASLDVVVTSNMFGDILTDEASVISGSLGLLPSASLGLPGKPGLYEPIHGSAPEIAGLAIANPLGMILSAALMLRESCSLPDEARNIERAVRLALRDRAFSADLGGTLSTVEVGEAVRDRLSF
jgi:3-isopropylmalate dehydrogenase